MSAIDLHKQAKRVAIVIDLKYALPWHQDCYQGIMRYADQHGWICSLDLYVAGVNGGPASELYDGVIGRLPDELTDRLLPQGLPISNLRTYVNANYVPRYPDLPGVYIDRNAAIRMAVKHLADNGYRRVAPMPMLQDGEDEVIGAVKEACDAESVELVQYYAFPGDFSDSLEKHTAMLNEIQIWLKSIPKPVGLMVISANISRLVAHVCKQLDLRVPEDVGIITPTGEQVLTTSGSPTITAVEFDHYQQGYEAASLLDKLMHGKPAAPLKRWIAPSQLVVRDSTDIFLCEDALVSAAMRYIAEHIREELTVNMLAEALDVSRRTLHRHFDEVLGRSVMGEISRLRMDYLKRLLSETNQSIAQISDSCGFSNPSHLTRFFKRMANETPTVYRKRQQARRKINST